MSSEVLKHTTTEIHAKTGIARKDRKAIAEGLAATLADSYVLFVNTQGLHWNVQGPLFYTIHKLTEAQYEDLFDAVDDIAERIRALGFPAPQSLEQFQTLSAVKSLPFDAKLELTIQALINGNETCAARMREAVKVADQAGDVVTADLLTERIGQHEENAWMLRATIAEA